MTISWGAATLRKEVSADHVRLLQLMQSRICLQSALEKQRRKPAKFEEFQQYEQISPPTWQNEVIALRRCLDTLLEGREAASEEEIIAALEGLQFAAHLVGPAECYSRDDFLRIADAIYAYWESAPGKISVHSILEAFLKLGTEAAPQSNPDHTVAFCLLRRLRDDFSAGNRRALQILATVFPYTSDGDIEAAFPNLWRTLVDSLSGSTGAVQAAKILAKLAIRSEEGTDALAARLLPITLLESKGARTVITETLLPAVFTAKSQLPAALLSRLSESNTNAKHLAVYLAVCRVALSAEKPADVSSLQVEKVLSDSLTHDDPQIRYESLRLLVLLPHGKAGTSSPIQPGHWNLHREFWFYNIDDLDSVSVQTGLIGVWKDFLARCRASSYASKRDLARLQKRDSAADEGQASGVQHADRLSYIQNFLEWWLDLVVVALRPGKSYRSVINALTYLEVLINSDVDPVLTEHGLVKTSKVKSSQQWGISLALTQRQELRERLLGCITFSTYVNVKQAAFALLQRWPLEPGMLQPYYAASLQLIQQQRDADIASGILLLRLCNVKYAKSKSISTYTKPFDIIGDLLSIATGGADGDYPSIVPHGVLSAVVQLLPLQLTQADGEHLVGQCLRIQCLQLVQQTWTVCKGVISADEGLEAENDDEVDDDEGCEDSVGSFNRAWRSVAAAADLLGTLMLQAVANGKGDNPALCAELDAQSQQFATWLSTITHRGAFTHIAIAYGKVCHCLNRQSSTSARVAEKWTNNHLDYILDGDRPLTRRGAGLPFLIAATLHGASKQVVEKAFAHLFASLDPKSQCSDVTKSHALNIIRALFQDGKLTSQTQPHAGPAFVHAVRGFGAAAWEVRNGSLLLYSALVYRSFGARKNLTTINKRVALSEFFGSNSTLIDLFQQELVLRVESTTSESLGSVFAILLVLSLLSASATSSYIVDALRPAVDTYTASSVWQVRVAAAAAMTGLTPASNMDETVCAALTAAAQSSHTNKVHGLLLRALYIIRTGDRAPSEDTVRPIQSNLQRMLHNSACLPIQTVALQILTAFRGVITAFQLFDTPVASPTHHVNASDSGYKAWVVARTQYLQQCDLEALPNLLARHGHFVPEALDGLDMGSLASASVVAVLKGLLLSKEVKHVLQTRLAGILASRTDVFFSDEDLLYLLDLHKQTTSIPLREALLPLLARNAHVAAAYDTVHAAIEVASDTSSEARVSACTALSYLQNGQILSSIPMQLKLLDFLQDEDSDIRSLATTTASRLLSLQKSTQTSKVLALFRQHVAANADASLAAIVVARQRQSLENLLQQLTANADVLFAEEKANVYRDEYADLSWMQAVCRSCPSERTSGDRERPDISALEQKVQAVIKQLDARPVLPLESPTVAEVKCRLAALQASLRITADGL